jgi:hypothetical protein
VNYLVVVVIALATFGCGRQVTLPSVEASSTHFHYFATSADRIPAGILDRLEQHRSDISGYLGLSDERATNYYRFDQAQDFNYLDCGQEAMGCTVGGSVFTTNVFDQHELIHAYLSSWRPGHIIAEGTAEAFHCGEALRDWVFATPSGTDWTGVVAQSPPDQDVYRWGVRLVLYLIRSYGPGRFLEYYKAAHETDDPALFALEFERFWGLSIDEVWAVLIADLSANPLPICPCGQPELPTDGSSVTLSPFSDYRVLPRVSGGQTVLLSIVAPGPKLVRCAGGDAIPLSGPFSSVPSLPAPALATILPDVDGYYVSFDDAGSIAGQLEPLVQPDCSASSMLTLPSGTDYWALVVPGRFDGAAWYVGVAGDVHLYRVDDGPVSVGVSLDCSFSPSEPISYLASVSMLSGYVELTFPSTSSVNAGLQGVLFNLSP